MEKRRDISENEYGCFVISIFLQIWIFFMSLIFETTGWLTFWGYFSSLALIPILYAQEKYSSSFDAHFRFVKYQNGLWDKKRTAFVIITIVTTLVAFDFIYEAKDSIKYLYRAPFTRTYLILISLFDIIILSLWYKLIPIKEETLVKALVVVGGCTTGLALSVFLIISFWVALIALCCFIAGYAKDKTSESTTSYSSIGNDYNDSSSATLTSDQTSPPATAMMKRYAVKIGNGHNMPNVHIWELPEDDAWSSARQKLNRMGWGNVQVMDIMDEYSFKCLDPNVRWDWGHKN